MITADYKELNRRLHADEPRYGMSGKKYVDPVRDISLFGRMNILDYGAGKCTLKTALGPAYNVTCYDPCIEGLDTPPEPHDVVVCTDVMEHIEPEFVDDVLRDIRRLSKCAALFSIALVPAKKVLADGRNAHVSLLSADEWCERVKAAGFTITSRHEDEVTKHALGLMCT